MWILLAILSDIHGNLEALLAVIEDAKQQGITQFAFLGDIMGYGPNPKEVLAKVQELNPVFCLIGNHEYFIREGQLNYETTIIRAKKDPREKYSSYAKDSLSWTIEQLSRKERTFLANLPKEYYDEENDIMYCHTVYDRSEVKITRTGDLDFPYIKGKNQAGIILNDPDPPSRIYVIGHTHSPLVYTLEEEQDDLFSFEGCRGMFYDDPKITTPEHISISGNEPAIINIGSVGQPRDKDAKACYIIAEAREFRFRRVSYPAEITCEKLIAISKELGNENFAKLGLRLLNGE